MLDLKCQKVKEMIGAMCQRIKVIGSTVGMQSAHDLLLRRSGQRFDHLDQRGDRRGRHRSPPELGNHLDRDR